MSIPAIAELAQRIKRVVGMRVASREDADWEAIACEAVTIATALSWCSHPFHLVLRETDDEDGKVTHFCQVCRRGL